MPVTDEVARSSIGPRSRSENQWTHKRRRCRLAQHTQTMFRLRFWGTGHAHIVIHNSPDIGRSP